MVELRNVVVNFEFEIPLLVVDCRFEVIVVMGDVLVNFDANVPLEELDDLKTVVLGTVEYVAIPVEVGLVFVLALVDIIVVGVVLLPTYGTNNFA